MTSIFCIKMRNSALDVDYLLSIVGTTSSANSVSEIELTALRALYHTRHIKLPDVRTSLVTSRFGDFLLRYCHFYNTSLTV